MTTIKIAGLVSLCASSLLVSVAAEPTPSAPVPAAAASTSTPPILSQSPSAGVIAAASPSPSPSSTPGLTAGIPSPSPVIEPTPVRQGIDGQVPIASSSATPSPTPGSAFGSDLLGGKEPVLDEEERAGVEVTNAWRQKSYESMVSQAGTTGSVLFRYGESYPAVVCAILQVTDIELEPGEVVTALNVGDTTRWSVESAVSGSGNEQVQHLIVKPRDIGLNTSLVVTTDRRTYHLVLVSDQTEFMHSVRFVYGHETAAATPSPTPVPGAEQPAKVVADPVQRRRSEPDGKHVSLVAAADSGDDTDDGYTITGKADWKPVSVYSKGGKTYIEMPASVRHKEAPVLFEETKKGWFHHEKILVNYRVEGKWYVVDKVIDNGTLVSGVGSGQVKVDIRHLTSTSKAKGGEAE
jgi:type IV secretion system protein TrbG